MSSSGSASDTRFHTPLARVLAIAVALSVVVGVVLLAFAWPSVTASPKDIPVGVVGPAAQLDTVKKQVADKADGAVKLTEYDDRAAAVTAIEKRDVYGAIVLGTEATDAPEVLIATAANSSIAQMLQGIATQLQAGIDAQIRTQVEAGVAQAQEKAAEQMKTVLQQALAAAAAGRQPTIPDTGAAGTPFTIPTVTVKVTDVVPLADTDERGTGLAVAAFPLVLGGLLGGVLLSLLVKGAWRRLFGVVVYSAVAGFLLAGVLQGWFGALQGSYLVNALALALAVGAISATVTGLYGLIGKVGIPLGAVVMMLFANPLSAATVPVEFLLRPWGAIGQAFPPGAAGTLLRDLSYFPDADTSGPWTVLVIWTVAGLVLTVLAGIREHRAARVAVTASAAPEAVAA
ncbi:hypothetical protein [Microbacterium gorillae]|uniref:hypothetical protein n=1 Tax=Microbacterium gorillae TaxID=1231063 RepID=UPI00058FDBB6|nr:hypothetical protein [Microbacterium gorillae]